MKLEGFAELDTALGQLPKATARNALRRTLKKAAQPVFEEAQANAPQETGKLEQSVKIGTRLTSRQRRDATKAGKSFAEIYIGTELSRGMFTNFGTFKDPPQLWFDRAWASTQRAALEIISTDMGQEIEKAARRYARKLGRL